MFDMRGNVVDDSKKRRVYCVQLSFAGSDQSVNGLHHCQFMPLVFEP